MNVSGKTVLIVGGAAGIGSAIAVELAKAGATVALTDISEAGLAETQAHIEAVGGTAPTCRVDLADSASVAAMASWADKTIGTPDLLMVTVVEYASVLGDIDDMKVDDWKRSFEINVFGYVRVLEAFLPSMRAKGSGSIVLTSSTAALLPDPSMAILLRYSAIKHALLGLSQALAVALEGSGVKSISFCPSGTATKNAADSVRASKFSVVANSISKGASPDDVARLFVEELEKDEFLICAHPNYANLIVELAKDGLDPVRFMAAQTEAAE